MNLLRKLISTVFFSINKMNYQEFRNLISNKAHYILRDNSIRYSYGFLVILRNGNCFQSFYEFSEYFFFNSKKDMICVEREFFLSQHRKLCHESLRLKKELTSNTTILIQPHTFKFLRYYGGNVHFDSLFRNSFKDKFIDEKRLFDFLYAMFMSSGLEYIFIDSNLLINIDFIDLKCVEDKIEYLNKKINNEGIDEEVE